MQKKKRQSKLYREIDVALAILIIILFGSLVASLFIFASSIQ